MKPQHAFNEVFQLVRSGELNLGVPTNLAKEDGT